jgi:hypothetical protein
VTSWPPLETVLGGSGIAALAVLVLRFILNQAAGVGTDKHKAHGEVVVHEGYAALIANLRTEIDRLIVQVGQVRTIVDDCERRHRERDIRDGERDMEIALLKSRMPQ